ncbi:MAG: 50S ribosomal protein L11 [Methanobacteriota archaeon]|nr:MAG: 50S ribosomal protein L11 [Euryarchaeota archaeon]
MGDKQVVETLVEAGKATPGPPIGPALGPLGVNVTQVVQKINEKTKDLEGMKIPVKIIVDKKTKEFEIELGTPPVSALIKKEVGAEKGASNAREEKIGNITLEQAKKIAEMKLQSLLSYDLKSATKEVIGTCVTLGVTVEGKHPKEIQKEIDQGVHDHIFK